MQFVRYLLVQVLAYGVDMGGFILLFTHFRIDSLVANMIGKVLAGLFAFVIHCSFTFGIAEADIKIQRAVRYFVLLALNIPLSALVLAIILRVTPIEVVAKLVADMVCVFFSYWVSKRFVFFSGSTVKKNAATERSEI